MDYPPTWKPGQPLGVVAPASAPRTPEMLQCELHALEADGYPIQWDPGQLSKQEYLSGSDSERAAQFHQALVHARHLIAVRGGYGCLRILNRVDYAVAQNRPGVLIGYSDITALQLSLHLHAGWMSISGPVVMEWSEITATMKTELQQLLQGQIPRPIERLHTEREGKCSGTLLGGNLSTIVRMIGSGHLPDLTGNLLFVEDVNEPPYRIDALFTQLKNAGILRGLGGLILGMFTESGSVSGSAIHKTILDCVKEYDWPVVSGLDYGHKLPRCVLPVGVLATLTADLGGGCLDILEPITK